MSLEGSATGRTGSPGAAVAGGNRRLDVALLVIGTAQLMVVLDATIVNVALPYIQRALGFSGAGLEWVVNAYALSFGGLLLIGGRAGDILGRRRVFVFGLLLFSAAASRMEHYSIPALPPMALLLAKLLRDYQRNGSHRRPIAALMLVAAALMIAAVFVVPRLIADQPWLAMVGDPIPSVGSRSGSNSCGRFVALRCRAASGRRLAT